MLKRYFFGPSRRLTLAFLCTLALVHGLAGPPTIAQGVNQATITQVLDGSDVFIQNRKAKVKESAAKGQRIRTGETRAELKFDSGAIGRLAHNSALTVGKCARLKKGTILINGAMNGCSGSAVAGVRGTTYIMEVDDAGTTKISVMEGEVTVSRATPTPDDDPEEVKNAPPSKTKQFRLPFPIPRPPINPTSEPAQPEKPIEKSTGSQAPSAPSSDGTVMVAGGETVSVSTGGQVGGVKKLTDEDYRRLLTGALFNGYSIQIPGIDKVRQTYSRLFPGLPFPISLPSIKIRAPFRLPF
jgi:hypothetical protein